MTLTVILAVEKGMVTEGMSEGYKFNYPSAVVQDALLSPRHAAC